MSEQSRARAEDALRQHMENQPVRADWLTEAALNHCCVECDRHWPCPTVLLARDVLKLHEDVQNDYKALWEADSAKLEQYQHERDTLRVKLEGLVEVVEGLVQLQPESEYRDRLRAALDKASK